MTKKIRWVIAHHPEELFWRTAEQFAKELDILCPGDFEVEIHTTRSFNDQYDNKLSGFNYRRPDVKNLEILSKDDDRIVADYKVNKNKWEEMFKSLEIGDFEMAQTPVSLIGHHCHKSFTILDLPFLFRDHDHVSDTLDNEIGTELLSNISENRNLVGLGFTYSGGYRIIGATESITSLDDLKKLTMFTYTIPGQNLFSSLDVDTVDLINQNKADFEDTDDSESGSIETTYLRFSGNHVLKTDHSVYMTTILASKKFFDSLTDHQKECYNIAAKRVAKLERGWSVDDAKKYEDSAKVRGITITELSSEDKEILEKAAKKSYVKTVDKLKLDVDLIKRIKLH